MESHILNSYHQARYRPIGHKVLRVKTDSVSSESSFTQNSPEYNRISVAQRVAYTDMAQSEESNGEDWCQNQTMNTTQSNQDTSSDDDSSQEDLEENGENIIVQEVNIDDLDEEVDVDDDDNSPVTPNSFNDMQLAEGNNDDTLVEGHDYDIITVYTVNPDLDLIEASSEDETDQIEYNFSNKEYFKDREIVNGEDTPNYRINQIPEPKPNIRKQVMDILSAPIESNVDDYFIKNELLDSDEPVVKDVDEYFIKETKPNVNNLIVKQKVLEEESIPQISENTNKIDESLMKQNVRKEPLISKPVEKHNNADNSISESDLEVLPNIEDLKRYLLEDIPYTKFRNMQRSCSLPQSPMQNICMDVDDAKTCLSFEDLNLDLSDLNFDNDKDKSNNSNKSDDIPRTLTDEDINSFLITNKDENKEIKVPKDDDDLNQQDMEIDNPIEGVIHSSPKDRQVTSTLIPETPTVLNFCIQKTPIKKEIENKPDDDFVDVESCNDMVIPVLEANNLNSLLEQFEATEKLNTKKKSLAKVEDNLKTSKNTLTNGMRLQDAGVQLNKNKMRHILMPSTINTTIRSPSPVHSDHDYCSSKKRHSVPNLKGGQSLLKPEVLSSNNRILKSRHRSCKNKKIVYHLSSDDESETSSKKKSSGRTDDEEIKKKVIKQPIKTPAQSNCRKKLSPPHSSDSNNVKDNSSVIVKSACKAGDTPSSRNSGSIKLTIKNKSEVILNNCDFSDSQNDKNVEKCKFNVSDSTPTVNIKPEKHVNDIDRNKSKCVNNVNIECVNVKQEPHPTDENFYAALFSNKQDVHIPTPLPAKSSKRLFDEELDRITFVAMQKDLEQPQKKKKLNLLEYKMRRGANSNQSSTTVSPEAIFPDMPSPLIVEKTNKLSTYNTSPSGTNGTDNTNNEAPKKIFDPIREASRKILMNSKKQKAEATRKRDEDIVMSKIPKVENLELQPLISDAEMMKIVGMATPDTTAVPIIEKLQKLTNFKEIILVSIGTNTDSNVFKRLQTERKAIEVKSRSTTPPIDAKSLINFKIKRSDHVLKQNVFDTVKRDKKSPVDDKKHTEPKIDKERFKGITAAIKSVEKQVDTKISSNSLFASIQDVVMKKAPEVVEKKSDRTSAIKCSERKEIYKLVPVTIVREYNPKHEHGEDKVILHLDKDKQKPESSSIKIQTDNHSDFDKLVPLTVAVEEQTTNRKRTDSDMSISREGSPHPVKETMSNKIEEKLTKPVSVSKVKTETRPLKRSTSKEKSTRSRDYYESKYRRRSRSISRRRRRRSRSISRSRGRYRRYRRSDSPYKRKRRSRSYRRRSPSIRRDHRSNRSRTRSRTIEPKPKSPVKKKPNPVYNDSDKKSNVSFTPPLRKPTVSESSESSTSSSSTSSSSSSSSSGVSRKSRSPYKQDDSFKKKNYRSFSSEDRESNTPVEERRIVFVGKLEKDITKSGLRAQFSKFGPVIEVRLHSKEDGSRYGFVTYQRARDAWSAVEAANTFPQYDVGFGGRRAFCRQSYADLDGLEAKYTESAFHGQPTLPARRTDDMSFEQMLLEMKKKLSQRKTDKKRPNDAKP